VPAGRLKGWEPFASLPRCQIVIDQNNLAARGMGQTPEIKGGSGKKCSPVSGSCNVTLFLVGELPVGVLSTVILNGKRKKRSSAQPDCQKQTKTTWSLTGQAHEQPCAGIRAVRLS